MHNCVDVGFKMKEEAWWAPSFLQAREDEWGKLAENLLKWGKEERNRKWGRWWVSLETFANW